MKITRRQLRHIIREEVVAIASPDKGTAMSALKWLNTWNSKRDMSRKGSAENDPAIEPLLRKFWDHTKSSWAKSKGLTTGKKGDPAGPAWSAAFISTVESDPNFDDSIRHSDYMDSARVNRKKFDAGDNVSNLFVGFKPGEIKPKSGDKRCYPREGGKHCDICIDDNCNTIIGGNVGDDLTRRSSKSAPRATMYITKGPTKLGAAPGAEKVWKGEMVTEITKSRLRTLILEEISTAGARRSLEKVLDHVVDNPDAVQKLVMKGEANFKFSDGTKITLKTGVINPDIVKSVKNQDWDAIKDSLSDVKFIIRTPLPTETNRYVSLTGTAKNAGDQRDREIMIKVGGAW